MKRKWNGILTGAAVLVSTLLLSMPAQAAVGDADYIAKTNQAIINSRELSTTVTLYETLPVTMSGRHFTSMASDDASASYSYDADGNLVRVDDVVSIEEMAYDTSHSLISFEITAYALPQGYFRNPSAYNRDAYVDSVHDIAYTPSYDAAGRLLQINDSNDVTDTVSYDALGRLTLWQTQFWIGSNACTTDYLYFYDAQNRLSKVQEVNLDDGTPRLMDEMNMIKYNRYGEPLVITLQDDFLEDDAGKTETIKLSYYQDGALKKASFGSYGSDRTYQY
ncbi:MAG: RHS repeat domain-containing protein [Lachnospiraceae bacterium]